MLLFVQSHVWESHKNIENPSIFGFMKCIVSGSFGSYQIKEIKGEGSYGCVALCTDMSTNQDVAMKICQRQKSGTNRHEANVLRKLRYMSSEKNLVRFHTAFEYQDHYCLVLEHLDQSLFDLMESEDFKPFHVSDIRYITEQLLVTFKELAKRGFIHGDLKPDNIMLVNHRLQPFKIKLIDFGLSMPVRSLVPGYIFQSIGYRAPEVSLGTKINEAIDMWGLGCVLAFLYLGQNFFPVHCEYEMMRIITQTRGMPDIQQLLEGEFGLLFFKRKKEKTRQFFEFLNKLLEVNPAKRITPEKALTHSFITQEAHTQKLSINNTDKTLNGRSDKDPTPPHTVPTTTATAVNEFYGADGAEYEKSTGIKASSATVPKQSASENMPPWFLCCKLIWRNRL
uniref:Protein kinase domain-containing protein n=1 Tax=Periophthalmus magnuspinnatus TaxID=409849 RepID=A0A3B3ZVW6_9GOBI